jgi:hypothetical protein
MNTFQAIRAAMKQDPDRVALAQHVAGYHLAGHEQVVAELVTKCTRAVASVLRPMDLDSEITSVIGAVLCGCADPDERRTREPQFFPDQDLGRLPA